MTATSSAMAVFKRFSPNLRSAVSIVMMIVVWLAFAPTQVGGMASYIIVIGKSMEPKFHKGDLVIAHREPVYQLGDAVVYRNLELKSFVFHRIIAQDLRRYTLKGDNNTWTDTYKPSSEEVVGKLWLYIPRGGAVIQKIRSPFVMALIVGAIGAVLAASLVTKKAKGKKPMNYKTVPEWFASINQRIRNWLAKSNQPKQQKPSGLSEGEILEGSFFALGLIALLSLILGIIAFSRSTFRSAQEESNYQHLGVFSYSAPAPQTVYDANTIKNGDPIFTKLTCFVDVNFQYTLVGPQAENITGTYQLTATITEQIGGWQRSVPLQEETSFSGTAFGTTARLDLCKLEALTQSLEQETSFHPSNYTLLITPYVQIDGELSGRALKDTFRPTLTFQYDRIQFYLVKNDIRENPLISTQTGTMREERIEANTLLLLGREIAIPSLRLIVLFGFIISVGGLVFLGWRVQKLSRSDQNKFFHIRYSSSIIDIENVDSIQSDTFIDVHSMDALAKLAEHFNTMILHAEQEYRHQYHVQAGASTYRFIVPVNKRGSTVPDGVNESLSPEGER